MARIDQRLLNAIAEKKGVLPKNVYPMISAVSREMFVGRDLAALVVASRLHININKFATSAQLEALRGLTGGRAAPASTPAAVTAVATSSSSRGRGPTARAAKPKPKDNSVFVIHGRDIGLRDSMYEMLSALGCKPLEFQQAVARVRGTGNPWIGDVLDKVFAQAQALIVLFSPDDETKLKDHFVGAGEKQTEGKLKPQARANVIYEAGMAMARHQEKTIMVQVGTIKGFSDIFGRHIMHLNNSPTSRNNFVLRLEQVCKVDRTGNRWMEVGDFTPAIPKPKKKKVAKKTKKRS
jgi:predicted nucleotide-binding protein